MTTMRRYGVVTAFLLFLAPRAHSQANQLVTREHVLVPLPPGFVRVSVDEAAAELGTASKLQFAAKKDLGETALWLFALKLPVSPREFLAGLPRASGPIPPEYAREVERGARESKVEATPLLYDAAREAAGLELRYPLPSEVSLLLAQADDSPVWRNMAPSPEQAKNLRCLFSQTADLAAKGQLESSAAIVAETCGLDEGGVQKFIDTTAAHGFSPQILIQRQMHVVGEGGVSGIVIQGLESTRAEIDRAWEVLWRDTRAPVRETLSPYVQGSILGAIFGAIFWGLIFTSICVRHSLPPWIAAVTASATFIGLGLWRTGSTIEDGWLTPVRLAYIMSGCLVLPLLVAYGRRRAPQIRR